MPEIKSNETIEDKLCPFLNGLALLGYSEGIVVGTIKYISTTGLPESNQLLLAPAVTFLTYFAYKLFRKGAQSILNYDLLSND